ncbi:MAG TPA: ABC transporter substrate-binding protein [Candidatus Dorea intestinavium]|nr:ABC transporter substrate-binding protein [Candidatus Dorea intestinavium]
MSRLSRGKIKGISLLLIMLMTVSLIGCGKTEAKGETEKKEFRTLTDNNKREVKVPKEVKSIVCLNVGSLRFTTYLEAEELVVGIEKNEVEKNVAKPYNYINNDKLAKLPIIGDNGEAYEEEILKLNPDVIVASYDKETADKLEEKLKIPVVTIPIVDNLYDDNYVEAITILGKLYQKDKRAAKLKAYIDTIKDDLNTRTERTKEEDKPLVYVGGVAFKGVHGIDGTEAMYFPLTAINAKNIADEAGKKEPYNMDIENIVKKNPEILFVDYNGLELAREDYQKNKELFDGIDAINNNQVYSQISYRFSALNVELALTDAYFAGKVIYPQEFEDIDIAKKSEEIFNFFLGENYYETLQANGMEYGEISLEK